MMHLLRYGRRVVTTASLLSFASRPSLVLGWTTTTTSTTTPKTTSSFRTSVPALRAAANVDDADVAFPPPSPLLAENERVILFDGVCNFCNTWVDLLLRVDVNERFRFTPLQSPVGRRLLTAVGKAEDDISSVVLVESSGGGGGSLVSYDKSACVLRVVEELGPVAAALTKGAEILVPRSLRDTVYDTVAENRYNLMGKRDQCRSGDPKYFDRFL